MTQKKPNRERLSSNVFHDVSAVKLFLCGFFLFGLFLFDLGLFGLFKD